MNGDELIQLIGLSNLNLKLNQYLSDNNIYDMPFLPEEDEDFDEDPYEATCRSEESTICEVERASIILIYDNKEEHYFLYPESEDIESGDFFLRMVVFYAEGVHDFIGFNGRLPFNLQFSNSRDDVHHITKTYPLFSRNIGGYWVDRHYINGFMVDISYDNNEIKIIHVKKPHYYDRKMLALPENEAIIASEQINIKETLKLFGEGRFSDKLKILSSDLSEDITTDGDCFAEVTGKIKEKGVTYYFYCSNKLDEKYINKEHDSIIFAGIRVNRRGYLNSNGFYGRLPYNLTFYDTPEQVTEKMGREADKIRLADQTILLTWITYDYLIEVLCSLIDYQVLAVSFWGKFMKKEIL